MIRRLASVLLPATLGATSIPAQTVDIPVQSNVLSINPSRVTDEDLPAGGGALIENEFDALSVGIDLGYSWLLGRTRQFFIGTGIGAKRLFLLGGGR